MTAAVPRLMTADELYEMEDDGCRHELVQGVLTSMPPAGPRHGRVSFRAAKLLDAHVEPRKLGRVYTNDTGFLLARNPDTVRGPDVAFVRAERLSEGDDPDQYFPFAPDLVVEVVSPSDRAEDIHDKVMEYLDAGAQLVIVLYPKYRSVQVWTPDRHARELRADAELDGGDVLPGFRVPVRDLFA